MPYWTTKDYFDPFPGLEYGLQRRRQAEAESQNKLAEQARQDAIKQHMLDTAVADQWKKRENSARAAQIAAQLGVDPVMGPDGYPDPIATTVIGNKKRQDDSVAKALGESHAIAEDFGGEGLQMTPAEIEITKNPVYRQSKADAEFRFTIERLRHRELQRSGVKLDAQGNPLIIDAGGHQYIESESGGLHELKAKSKGNLEPVLDQNKNPISGVWRDKDTSQIIRTRVSDEQDLLDVADAIDRAKAAKGITPTNAVPSAATGATPTVPKRLRYNPATGKLEPIP